MYSLSIKDVAKYAGCSTSTVSRVLNNRDAVDPETRKKILETIEKLHYKPNLVAQGLRVKKSNLLGLVVPEIAAHAFSEIVQYAMDAAYERGFNIITVNSHENPDLEENYIGDLLRRNINGIIFSRVSDESRIMPKILKKNIPIVIIDRTLENENVANVVLDNYEAGVIAAEHLLGLGHRHIACITGSMKIALCRDRLKGFKETLEKNDVKLRAVCIREANFDFSSGLKATRELLDDGYDFSAVWAINDLMAFGAMKALKLAGKRIPEDVSVLGMDDLAFGDMVLPSLSSVHYPFDELVEKAFDLITRQIEENRVITEKVVIIPSLTVKESTGSAPGTNIKGS
ncbi:MAG: LacI family transcriptional regulator [Spirochaetales bacterium]|nr:MAG: LacI family transcriptional regulator [Spirochaetales bacterium]